MAEWPCDYQVSSKDTYALFLCFSSARTPGTSLVDIAMSVKPFARRAASMSASCSASESFL